MLSRRHLRIKVLQSLYGTIKDDTISIGILEKNLFKSIDKIYELFLFHLSLVAELKKAAEQIIEEKRNKKLPTPEDLNPNLKFINNRLLIALEDNHALKKLLDMRKISWLEDKDNIRKLFKSITESKIYQSYMESGEDNFEEDKSVLVKIFKYHIADDEIVEHIFEEKNIHWTDDHFFVCGYLVKYIKSLDTNFNDHSEIPGKYKDEEDDVDFIKVLFRQTYLKSEEYETIVMQKAKNWESDRIALVDMILMKMAVCELINLKSIPIKVTLNEYIDLSKEYSTPKSKVFINGVLDKIVPELQKNGLMQKVGRGLLS